MNTNSLFSQFSRSPISLPHSVKTLNIIKAAKDGRGATSEGLPSTMVCKPAVGLSKLLISQPPMPGIVTSLNLVIAARKENAMIIIKKAKDKVSSPRTCSIISSSSTIEPATEKGSPLAALDYFDSISIITCTTEAKKVDNKKKPHAKKAFGTASSLWGTMAMCLMFFGTQSPNLNTIPALPFGLDLGSSPSFSLYQPQPSPTIPFHRGATCTSN